jgi:hypothetical protein
MGSGIKHGLMEMMRYILIAIVVFSLNTFTSCDYGTKENSYMTGEIGIEQKIRDNLPLGSSRKAIEQFFSENKIEYSWVEDEKRYYAIIRDIESKGMVKKSISIILSFDDSLTLSNIKIEPVYTGL